jgi:hypothetical protein
MLQTSVAILYFINKVLLSLGKKAGWQIGIIASTLAIFYFFTLKLYLLAGLEISFLTILVYGLENHNKTPKNSNLLYVLMSIILVFLYFVLKNSTLMEFIISFDFILAIFFLAKNKWTLGWIVMFVGHLLMAYFTFAKGQTVFATLQALSCFVAIYALARRPKQDVLGAT